MNEILTPTINDVKDFWNKRPCNIKHSQKELGTIEYFNEVEKRKYFVEPHILDFAEFPKWQNKRVLEIGCGIGTDAINFVRNGAKYTGIELSQQSLNLTKTRFKVFNLSAELIIGNAEDLSSILIPQKFDLIYSFGVLHHTPNLLAALNQITDYCHEESRVKIMVYAKNSWKQKMIEANLDQPEAQFGCPIANTYGDEEIRELLKQAGLAVLNISQAHIFPYKIEAYKNHEYQKEDYFESMPEQTKKVLDKNFGWHLLIDAKPN